MEDEHLADVVVAFGYAEAARLCDINIAALHKRMKAQGWLDEIQLRRGRRPQGQRSARRARQSSHYDQACELLGICRATLNNYLNSGRLSSPLDLNEVEALRSQWAIVPREQFAAQLSRLDPRWRQCLICGSFFRIKASWVRQGRGSTCSSRCRGRLRSKRATPKLRVVKVRLRLKPVARLFFAGSCVECASTFVSARPTVHCSSKCNARTHRKLRKARKRGAVKADRVFKRKIYERDNWRCHICGKKVDRSVRPDHPRAPSLDHIHPFKVPGDDTGELAGPHHHSNVKTAHLGCNASRSNRAEFQMTMPIAV